MSAAVYLGDEVSGAGWRLAGVCTQAPAASEATAALAQACAGAPLVLVSAALAAHIEAATLSRALCALQPLVLVVPDPQGEAPPPDLAGRLRRQLGMEA